MVGLKCMVLWHREGGSPSVQYPTFRGFGHLTIRLGRCVTPLCYPTVLPHCVTPRAGLRVVMLRPTFFKEFTDRRIPPHFGLIDTIVGGHVKLRSRALRLLASIFEYR